MVKKYTTRKLWYNKFMYKINLRNPINKIFSTRYGRYSQLEFAYECLEELDFLYKSNNPLQLNGYRNRVEEYSTDDYFYAKKLVEKFEELDSYRLRIDYYALSIYLENEEDLDSILNDPSIKPYVREVHKPREQDISSFLDDASVYILNEPLPYEYRVHIKSGKNPELADWLENNKDKSRITEKALENLRNYQWCNCYFYLRDSKLMLLIEMLSKNSIGKVERLVYKGNTDK